MNKLYSKINIYIYMIFLIKDVDRETPRKCMVCKRSYLIYLFFSPFSLFSL